MLCRVHQLFVPLNMRCNWGSFTCKSWAVERCLRLVWLVLHPADRREKCREQWNEDGCIAISFLSLSKAFQRDEVSRTSDFNGKGLLKTPGDFCSVLTGVYLKTVLKREIALLQVKMMMMMILAQHCLWLSHVAAHLRRFMGCWAGTRRCIPKYEHMIYIYILYMFKFSIQIYLAILQAMSRYPKFICVSDWKNIRFSQSLSMWTLGSKLGSKIRMGCGCGCHFRDKTALVVVFSQINGWIVCLFLVFFGVKFENFNIPDFFLRLSPQGWWIRQWNQEPQQLFLAPSSNVAFFDLYSLYLDLHWRPLDFQRTSDVCYFFATFLQNAWGE